MIRLTHSLEWEDDAIELLDSVAYDLFEIEYFDLNFEQKMMVLVWVGELLDENATSQKKHGL